MNAVNIGEELIHYSITRFVRPREEELITHLISIGRYSKSIVHFKRLFSYNRINSTRFPATGAGNASESRLMSQVGRVREVVCA